MRTIFPEIHQQQATMLVVIDSGVEAPQTLAQGVQPGAATLRLDDNTDAIAQITAALAAGNYTRLHLVGHGSAGSLHLGKTKLTLENLSQYRQQLLEWGVGEILIYGCEVAKSPTLLQQLYHLTGANIAASAQKVGKGNWHLEWQIGEINSDSAFTSQLRQEYQGEFAVNFDPQVTFATGNAPEAVAIGDFDGDGDANDIAVANYYGGNVTVLLADGSGGFTSSTLTSTGSELAVGDFNQDGTDDIALANFNNVSLLLSDGSGGFTSSSFDAGNGETSVAVGDFNNDDNLDLAVSNQNDQNVATFLGDGSGGFSASTTVSTGSQATFVEVGDLDGDGEVDDLVVARRLAGSVAVFLGDNSGGFSPITTFATDIGPVAVAIGDLDGDGFADDIAVANYFSDNVSVLLNDGSGGFSAQTTFAVGDNPRGIAIGDLNGDGDGANDIAVANKDETNVSVLSNDGSGGFSAQETFAVGTDGAGLTRGVAIGDLDGGGAAQDLVVTNQADNTVSVLINNPTSPNTPTPGDDDLTYDGDDNTIDALAGDDTIRARAGNDDVFGNDGADRLFGQNGNDTLDGGADNDRLIGGSNDDVLIGGSGNDVLNGGLGNDILIGVDEDSMTPGAGERDVLIGNSGADLHILGNETTPFYLGNANADRAVIRGFDVGVDEIQLFGSDSDYFFKETNKGNTNIFFEYPDSTRDLVGVVRDVTGLDKSDTDTFVFVEEAPF